MTRRVPRRALLSAVVLALLAGVVLAARGLGASSDRYVVRPLVSDSGAVPAAHHDKTLVNAWGLAASPTGPWWVGNEARGTSSLYAADGKKQLLTVAVPGGPTGVAYYGGTAFPVRAGGTAPARFVYACEDGTIRAWTATVPTAWSDKAEVVVDQTGKGAIFRAVAFANGRLYATDFHNGRVDVFDDAWHELHVAGSFTDPDLSPWYSADGLVISGGRVFVSYVFKATVDGNDLPDGGYVDEYDLQGHLVARVASTGDVDEPWGLAVAPEGFGRFGGDLLVASFASGHIDAFRRDGKSWKHAGTLTGTNGKPLVLNGVWGIAFGNGGLAGAKTTLFAAAGPHQWRGASELEVHGLITAISPS